jgi:predicted ATPase/DNA-binding SARP family transcriptional activator
MARLSLSLLGLFQVTLDGTPITGFRSDRARALLTYLALEADRPHRRDALAGLLWPDVPDTTARNDLRQTLHRLRQAIGDTQSHPAFLHFTPESVQFISASAWLDVTAFDSLLSTVDAHRHRRIEACAECVARLREAAELYRGDFLHGFILENSLAFSEWVAVRREGLHRRALEALYYLAEYHRRRGENERALFYAHRQLELEPWCEEAHRQVMSSLAHSGQRTAALAQYATCRQVLQEELGVEPSDETQALYERLQAVRGGPKHNLPPQPTPFIGREDELAEIAGRLADPDCRLLTLVGPGGIGKSRVALRAAENQIGSYLHGVYLVPLAGVGSVDVIPAAIATALGLELKGQARAQLVGYLRDTKREILLVLDNFEHLLAATDLLIEILQNTQQIKLLVTSQERLNVQREWVLPIDGLPFPTTGTLKGIEQYAAVALFLQTARRVRTDFVLGETEKPFVARICQVVEGMPLAIELAASWTRALSSREIAGEVEAGIGILTTSARDVPERHRNIRAVLNHAWSLLAKDEQSVLRNLSVFRGGFSREAAEQAAGASLASLSSLVDKSLLRLDSQPDETQRYNLHELVRQYAQERLLEEGEAELMQVRERHLDYFLGLAEHAQVELSRASSLAWLNLLDRNFDNLRVAFTWASVEGSGAKAQLLVGALWWFWCVRGHVDEACRWAEHSLTRGSANAAARAKATWVAGFLNFYRGNQQVARELLEQGVVLCRGLGPSGKHDLALALNYLGVEASRRGDLASAQAYFEESLALRRELGDVWGVAQSLVNLGYIAHKLGDPFKARSLCEEGLMMARASGEQSRVAFALANLGELAADQANYSQARTLHKQCLLIYREFGSKYWCAAALESLLIIEARQADTSQLAKVARLWGAVEALHKAHGSSAYLDQETVHQIDTVRTRLGEAAFLDAWNQGLAMTLNEAVDYAIEESEEYDGG